MRAGAAAGKDARQHTRQRVGEVSGRSTECCCPAIGLGAARNRWHRSSGYRCSGHSEAAQPKRLAYRSSHVGAHSEAVAWPRYF